MHEEITNQVAAAQRHIIERPRLTKLLDESTARVILLTAPAGYGKTTLARQWMATQAGPKSWYSCSIASADTAEFGSGVARAARDRTPDAEARFRAVLAGSAGSRTPQELAAVLADGLARWPQDGVIAIDDYHMVMDALEVDAFVAELVRVMNGRFLVTSRVRPRWATSRMFLYGEVAELTQQDLLMNQDEAARVLVETDPRRTASLIESARGWPAIVGLGALTAGDVAGSRIDGELHDFLADELYNRLTDKTRAGLLALSVAPNATLALASDLLGPTAEDVIAEAIAGGFLLARGDVFELHPLLRQFLTSKIADVDERLSIAKATADHLVRTQSWDDAFNVASAHHLDDVVLDILHKTATELLQTGRVTTLARWLRYANRRGIRDPFLVLTEGDVAFWEGRYERAERLRRHVIGEVEDDDPLAARAWFKLAQGTYFLERPIDAIEQFGRARELARTEADGLEAVWGALCAACYGGSEYEATQLLAEFDELDDSTPEFRLRAAAARCSYAMAFGGVDEPLDRAACAEPLLRETSDAVVRTSFLYAWSGLLILNAQYERGEAVTVRGLEDADRNELALARVVLLQRRATALAGRGRYSRAQALLDQAEREAASSEDRGLWLSILKTRARLAAVTRETQSFTRGAASRADLARYSPIYPEYAASLALLALAQGRTQEGLAIADDAAAVARTLEPSVDIEFIRALASIQLARQDAPQLARRAFDRAITAGALDSFVFAYRVSEALVTTLLSADVASSTIAQILYQAGDRSLATRLRVGLPERTGSAHRLTARENEILRFVAQGLTNREIADRLFVSPVTVKVHLRHVFEKLGVRSRTEAALRAQASDLL